MARVETFFDNVDATVNQTSGVFTVECSQDMRFLIQFVKSGTNGDPRIYIEESVDGVIWTSMLNPTNCESYFDIDQTPQGIKDNYFMGFHMRLRLEPNTNSSGTISAKMGYKTKV
jgi:hypothetical protein